ncbi:MAG: aspartate kinase [Clostridiales bacterium]
MKVCKFGGTSLATSSQIKKVCDIITMDSERKIIVVSAPGKRDTDDIKVTDLLIKCASNKINKKNTSDLVNKIISRFNVLVSELELSHDVIEEIKKELQNKLSVEFIDENKFLDSIKSFGEDCSAKILSAYMKVKGHNAIYINPKDAGMILSDESGNARVLQKSYNKLNELKYRDEIIIFPGFFGYNINNEIVTFSRGGSDITGSIIAAAVDADLYENFTDVDSVFVANPNIVKDPKSISILTYREMRELSYAGFSVLHEETLEPVYKKNIPVCIKNTNNPDSKGTFIVTERKINGQLVTGIAGQSGFCSILVSKYMMNREIGFGRKLLSILENECLPYDHIPSGIDNISIILSKSNFSKDVEKRVLKRINEELKADYVYVQYNIALIMVVGEGMRHSVGLASRATKAMAKVKTNIEMINQGSSEVSMMFGIIDDDLDRTVKSLYKEFFE